MVKIFGYENPSIPSVLQGYDPCLNQFLQGHQNTKFCMVPGQSALEIHGIRRLDRAIYADKICVDEEMVRLHSHIDATRKELEAGGSVGRKLDFIAQEMNREANTTLSKSSDLEICDKAIALKTEIEKVREQIQNIE